MPLLSGPDFTCPHCGEVGIRWSDKWRCANHGTSCQCRRCGGYAREMPGARTRNSVALYVMYLLLFALLAGMVAIAGDGLVLLACLPLLGCAYLLIRYGGVYYSAIRVPLVADFSSPLRRWLTASGGGLVGAALFAICGLAMAWMRWF